METNAPAVGLIAARVGQMVGRMPDEPTNAGLYWRLRNIESGPYWLGVLYETGEGDAEANFAGYVAMYPERAHAANGHAQRSGPGGARRVVRRTPAPEPLVALEAGDEIAVAP